MVFFADFANPSLPLRLEVLLWILRDLVTELLPTVPQFSGDIGTLMSCWTFTGCDCFL